jgi:hypothetical protein
MNIQSVWRPLSSRSSAQAKPRYALHRGVNPVRNYKARKRRPLPRKTVAKNWSSSSPRRSRNTPINHKNAMPANGTKLSAKATSFELILSHAPVSCGLARTRNSNTKSSAAGFCMASSAALVPTFVRWSSHRNSLCPGRHSGNPHEPGGFKLMPGLVYLLAAQGHAFTRPAITP